MAATDTLQSFNVFLTERLSAAAVEIFGFVEKTLLDYQDEVYRTQLENRRLQRLLDLVYNPEIKLHRADSRQITFPTLTTEDSFQREWIPGLGLEETCPIPGQGLEETCPVPGLGLEETCPIKEEQVEQRLYPGEEEDGLTDEVLRMGQPAENETPPENDGDSVAHSRGKYFSCHICGKTVKSRSYMKRHISSHTSEKPFACPICGNRYKLKGHVKEHIRTHTGERPYSCYICGKTFNRCTTMSKHARIAHKETRPYKCLHCSERFPLLLLLKQHMKYSHDITVEYEMFSTPAPGSSSHPV